MVRCLQVQRLKRGFANETERNRADYPAALLQQGILPRPGLALTDNGLQDR